MILLGWTLVGAAITSLGVLRWNRRRTQDRMERLTEHDASRAFGKVFLADEEADGE